MICARAEGVGLAEGRTRPRSKEQARMWRDLEGSCRGLRDARSRAVGERKFGDGGCSEQQMTIFPMRGSDGRGPGVLNNQNHSYYCNQLVIITSGIITSINDILDIMTSIRVLG